MISKKLSLNKVCIILATTILLLSVVMFSVLYILTKEMSVVFCSMAFCLLFLLCVTVFVILIRRKLTLFSEILCCTLDEMMNGKIDISQVAEEENLFYKINHRLVRLYEVMQESKNSVASERADLQELISDISHQVKTPIANLKMVNATLLEQEVPSDKQREFLLASGTQLDKLDFLMQAMIKTSRLETGVISLEKKQQPIYDTLAMALGGIFLNAERKHIQVEVNCPETLVVSHDRKWTAEALFNILDNAVKYTPEYGSIRVCVESWEMHLKVSITDTGKGIPENQQGAIFRRFYREENVHDIEGIGIGLYLAREIISLQNGYIQVTSQVGKSRNIIAIIAIALTTILFTTIFTLGSGLIDTVHDQNIRKQGGDGQAVLNYISDEVFDNIKGNEMIEQIAYTKAVSYQNYISFLLKRAILVILWAEVHRMTIM